MTKISNIKTHTALLLLLRLQGIAHGCRHALDRILSLFKYSRLRILNLTFCLSFSDLAGRSSSVAATSGTTLGPLFVPLLFLLGAGLGKLDDDGAAVEVLIVELCNSLLGRL